MPPILPPAQRHSTSGRKPTLGLRATASLGECGYGPWMVKRLESHVPGLEGRKLSAMGREDTMSLAGKLPTEMPITLTRE